MPIYAYRCNECGHEFELRQRMMDDPLSECPECQGEVRRVVNSVGVVFKGSGFYITDNRGGSNSASKPSKEGAAAPAESASSTADTTSVAEAKPADKKKKKKSESATAVS